MSEIKNQEKFRLTKNATMAMIEFESPKKACNKIKIVANHKKTNQTAAWW